MRLWREGVGLVFVERGEGLVCEGRDGVMLMPASLCWATVRYGILPNCTKSYPRSVLEYSVN